MDCYCIPSLRKITREGRDVLTYVKRFRRRGRELEKWKKWKKHCQNM